MNVKVIKFGVVGILNTIIGYSLGVVLYLILKERMDAYLISVLAGFMSIFFSISLQRRYVFESTGPMYRDFARGFIVYGGIILYSGFIFKALVDFFSITIYLSQAFVLAQSWILSYLLLKNFAFRVQL